jgi:hypothetical protein
MTRSVWITATHVFRLRPGKCALDARPRQYSEYCMSENSIGFAKEKLALLANTVKNSEPPK